MSMADLPIAVVHLFVLLPSNKRERAKRGQQSCSIRDFAMYMYVCIYVHKTNGDGRNGQTTQAGAAVSQALMMAAPCGI